MAFKFIALFALVSVASAGHVAVGPAYGHGSYAIAAPAYAQGAYAVAAPAYSQGAYAVAAPAYVKTVAAPAYVKTVEYEAPAKYDFSYGVSDSLTGDHKSQVESRDGDNVHGSYSLIDSDGFKRTVEYTADEHNGFNAVVHREPLGHAVAGPVAKIVAPVASVAQYAPAHYAAQYAPAHYAAQYAPAQYTAQYAPVTKVVAAASPVHYAASPVAYAASPVAYAASPVAKVVSSAHYGPSIVAGGAHYAPAGYATHYAPAAYTSHGTQLRVDEAHQVGHVAVGPAHGHGSYAIAAPAYAQGAYAVAAPAYSQGAYAVAAPAYVKTVAAPAYVKTVEYEAPAKYDFSYGVSDSLTGDHKSQVESRDGDNVHGSYSLIDSDGFKRTVEYTADEHNGFNAVVHREPLGHAVAGPVAKIVAPVASVAQYAPAHYAAQYAPAHYAAQYAPAQYTAQYAPVTKVVAAASPVHYAASPVAYAASPVAYAASPVAKVVSSAHYGPSIVAGGAHYAPAGYATHYAPAAYTSHGTQLRVDEAHQVGHVAVGPAHGHGSYAIAAPAYAQGAYAVAAPAYSQGAYAVAAPAYVKTVAAPAYVKTVEYEAPAKYDFSYGVSDSLTGDHKSQVESRDGDNVHGSYSLIDSDGFKRTVEYTADEHNGFNAVVHREPLGHAVAGPVAKIVAPVASVAQYAPAHYAAQYAPAHYAAQYAPAQYTAQYAPVTKVVAAASPVHYAASPVAYAASPVAYAASPVAKVVSSAHYGPSIVAGGAHYAPAGYATHYAPAAYTSHGTQLYHH